MATDMRLMWVQQWAILPVIVEDRNHNIMEENVHAGGLPPGSQSVEPSARNRLGERERPTQARMTLFSFLSSFLSFLPPFIILSVLYYSSPPLTLSIDNAFSANLPHEFPLQMGNPQQHLRGQETTAYPTPREQSQVTFAMSGMAGALPEYQTTSSSQMSHPNPQRFLAGTSDSQSNYQPQPFPGQAPMSTESYRMHPSQYPYQPAYTSMQASPQSSHSGAPGPVHALYPDGAYFSASQQQYMYYPGQYGQSPPSHPGAYPTAYGHGSSHHAYAQQGGDMPALSGRTMRAGYSPGTMMPYPAYGSPGAYLRPGGLPGKCYLRASRVINNGCYSGWQS